MKKKIKLFENFSKEDSKSSRILNSSRMIYEDDHVDTLSKILYLSNTEYIEDAQDMQDKLEEINELIKLNYPNISEISPYS